MKNLKIYKIFKAARKIHKLSQKEMAQQLGVSQGTISKIEKGALGVDAGLWYEFCVNFNLNPDLTYGSGLLFFKSQKYEQTIIKEFFRGKEVDSFVEMRRLLPLIEHGLCDDIFESSEVYGVDSDLLIIPSFKVPIEILFKILDSSKWRVQKKDLLKKVINSFIDSKGFYQDLFEQDFKAIVKRVEDYNPVIDYRFKDHGLNIFLKRDFKFSIDQKDPLKLYIDFETRLLKKLWRDKDKYDEKGLSIKKVDDFNYWIERSLPC